MAMNRIIRGIFLILSVAAGTELPGGLDKLVIPAGKCEKIIVYGKMPDCIANAWKELWKADIPLSYKADFDVYDERGKDWSNATIDLYLSV
jgi:predicted transcriptional regulator YdeE